MTPAKLTVDEKELIAIIESYDIPIVDAEVASYLIRLKNRELKYHEHNEALPEVRK